ncbi:LuxR C-terminal-related transcriptional regulator [Pullulanibacillus sp. KACC 23026]|uniref:LuxR C-terminal-related transcriptional regulator n=1 Tax=Pullulanibacillus sp. KACC 23026 TaxID=3028315 RepID=UPI0023AFB83D|nr:LuxR C-terminal-related transcriptional regulator [Pullulanibacillus sp. KACC 23026]WEG12474.1 LuxR C-terminal-related transcriptional regulator [Pullulanibacillus sp. KACC 23026]
MENALDSIQQVQDVFASNCKLAIILLDLKGNPVTSFSGENSLAKMVQSNHSLYYEWIKSAVGSSVLDTFPGLKIVLSPVSIRGEIKYYLWAGVIIETESRSDLYKYIRQKVTQPSIWENAIEEVPETTSEEKKRIVSRILELSEVISKLLENDQKKTEDIQLIRSVQNVLELAAQEKKDTVSEILNEFLNLDSDLDFVGLAKKNNDNECVISLVTGHIDYQSLVGTNFLVGEGFLGQVLVSGIAGYWEQIDIDPRGKLFKVNDIKPQSLVCYPITVDNSITGVLFGVSFKKGKLGQSILSIGQVITDIISSYLFNRITREKFRYQLQKLNALIEISQLLSRIQDVKKIALMLVDMSMNIMQVSFSSLTLFDLDSNSGEVRIVSRGLTKDQSEKYGKQVLRRYNQLKDEGGNLSKASPVIRVSDWGETIIECPVYSQKLYGVLSVSQNLNNEDHLTFLSSLATIGALAINRTNHTKVEIQHSIALLHESVGYWDPQSYEFTTKLKKLAHLFLDYLEMSLKEREDIEYACLLSSYTPEFVANVLPDHSSVYKILQDFVEITNYPKYNRYGQRFDLGGQLLALLSNHLKDHELDSIDNPIDPLLSEKFRKFILRERALDQTISTKDLEFQIDKLSNRENEVLMLVVKGLNNKQLASQLFISEHTVKNHITNIFQKVNVKDRAGLIAYFYKQKMEDL